MGVVKIPIINATIAGSITLIIFIAIL
jgi:hypothetical protein